MAESKPPKSPGDFIKEELQSRGWTQADLATIINRHVPAVSELVQGKRQTTPELAVELGIAFDIHPEEWLRREAVYRLALLNKTDERTRRWTRLLHLAPVKEMEKRGWIKVSRTLEQLERELCSFLGVDSIDDDPILHAAARQPFKTHELTAAQRAWIFRAAQLARTLNVRTFSPQNFREGLIQIRSLAESGEKVRHVPRVLAELGVRLIVIEPLPRSRIDGAAFWLEGDQAAPVIALSLRYDRIDWFWHTLSHELIHIKYQDQKSVDTNLVGESRIPSSEDAEQRADKEGAEFLVSNERLESFIIRVRPFYYKERIVQFAKRMGVHPGIVNGQLQHRREIGWSANREMLVKVRDLVTASAVTDGWGKAPHI